MDKLSITDSLIEFDKKYLRITTTVDLLKCYAFHNEILIYKNGLISSFFLIFYSFFRFTCEYFREPDPHIGLQFLNLSLGQIYSIIFFIIGIILFLKKK